MTDYNAAAEAVQKLVAGNDEQQALLRSVLPVLTDITALQAAEAKLRESIAKAQADERAFASKRDMAEVEAGAFIGEYRKRRGALERELVDLEAKIAQARKVAPHL